MNATLQVGELNAGYGKVPVLRDVSFQVGEGEVVAIIGPNGAGKTTLLKTVSGLIRPTSGEIRFRGQSIGGLAAHEEARAGISQMMPVLPSKRGQEARSPPCGILMIKHPPFWLGRFIDNSKIHWCQGLSLCNVPS